MKHAPWTEDEIRALEDMDAAGITAGRIAQVLGRSRNTIDKRIAEIRAETLVRDLHPAETPKMRPCLVCREPRMSTTDNRIHKKCRLDRQEVGHSGLTESYAVHMP